MRQRRKKLKAAGLLAAACLCLQPICFCSGQSTPPYTEKTVERYKAARKYYSERNLSDSLRLVLENHQTAPGFTANSFLAGKIYYFENDHEQAERFWRHTLEVNAYHIDTRKWLARLLLQQGRTEEAGELLAEALSVSSEDAELLILMAKVERQRRNLAGAIELYEKAQGFAERLSEASIDLARIYYSFGLKDRAQEELQKARMFLGPDSFLSDSLESALEQVERARAAEAGP
jgi:tetratricopeptide (TPR) repeat protein